MKKHNRLKTARLITYVILAAACLALIFFNKDVYHGIAHDSGMRALCVILWLTFVFSFFYTILDFSYTANLKKDFSELDYAVHTDSLSGLANRFSADSIIESYLDKPVPRDFCCVMMDISNLAEINELHGHITGNAMIREFSDILADASRDLCYVARNGGNKFLAIFDKATESDIRLFSEKLQHSILKRNALPGALPIHYRTGMSWHEGPEANIKGVTDLIALANRRLYEDRA